MKIVIINNLYFPFNHGGAEEVVKKMINDLESSGQEVFLITTKPRRYKEKIKNKKKIKDTSNQNNINSNLKIYYLKSSFYNLSQKTWFFRFSWLISNIFSFKKYWQVKKILKKIKPDLVITHNLIGIGLLSIQAIRDLKIPHEHFLHDIQLLHPSGLVLLGKENKINNFPAKIYQLLSRASIAHAQKVVSPSRWLLTEHLSRNFFKNSDSVVKTFNFENLENKNKTTEKKDKEKEDKEKESSPKTKVINLLFVGQLEKHKGILWLIKVLKKLKKTNFKLTILGTGQEAQKIENLILNDRRFKKLGKVSSKEVKKVMLNSDYLIVPSLCYENSPRVIYEAQALKLPTLAAKIGGIPEIITKNDYLFTAGDEDSLKSLLKNKLS